MGHSIYVGSQTPAGGLSSVDAPPIMSLMPNELFGARLAAGKSVPSCDGTATSGVWASHDGRESDSDDEFGRSELTGQGILTASFLAGAGEEKVLAIVGKSGATSDLSKFLNFWKWSVRFLKSPFEVLSEIYKMLRQTEVAA